MRSPALRHRRVGPFHPWKMLTMEDMAIVLTRVPAQSWLSYRMQDTADYMFTLALVMLRFCFRERGI